MIPVNEPAIGQREIEYVMDCLETGWISSAGRYIREFEEKWADYCGMEYGVSVSSGTAALEAAVASIDLKAGEEVIIPTFTIISCAVAIVRNGGVPVLVDSDPNTWCLDVKRVEEKITPKTRAIMPVHMYGHPADMDPVIDLARRHDLVVIEDAAQAHGAEYKSKKCGGLGEISCFSFYGNKIITTGEGGMVLTRNEEYAERARSYRNLCFRSDRRFYHSKLGQNFRLTNMQAAVGIAQLERIDELVEKKRWIGQAYTERLQDKKCLMLPVEEPWARSVYWMYGIVLDESTGLDAKEFADRLRDEEVDTRPFFLGMHEQPVLLDMGLFAGESFPVADRIARQGLYLPSGMTLTEKQIDQVAEAVEKCLPLDG